MNNIFVKLEVISNTAGKINLEVQENDEGTFEWCATTYSKEFSRSEISEVRYDAGVYECEGVEDCHVTEVEIAGSTFTLNCTIEQFEETLAELNLLDEVSDEPEVAEVIQLSFTGIEEELEEMVA